MTDKPVLSADGVGKNIRIIEKRTGWATCSSLCFDPAGENYRKLPAVESDYITDRNCWAYITTRNAA